jgi:hypothetical protein
MNREEAKSLLMIYRPGTTDPTDPQISEALAFAKNDAELSIWLADQLARHESLAQSFKNISAPAGLKEQILSEYAASQRTSALYRNVIPAVLAVVMVVFLFVRGFTPSQVRDNDIKTFRNRMAGAALRGYVMDYETNNLAAISNFLRDHQAPSEFVLPTGLAKLEPKGCSVQTWQKGRATMICFHTGRPQKASVKSDLWLFIVDAATVKGGIDGLSQFGKVNSLNTAVWEKQGKIYFLGVEGEESLVKSYM